jgi:hypothetical protein
MGTGRGRTGIPRKKIVERIAQSIVDGSKTQTFSPKLSIVIRSADAEMANSHLPRLDLLQSNFRASAPAGPSANLSASKGGAMRRREGSFFKMSRQDDSQKTRVQRTSPFCNTAQAAHYLRLSARMLERLRKQKEGPPFRRHGRFVFYHIDDLEAWSRSTGGPQADHGR